jgi:hypothetical protein
MWPRSSTHDRSKLARTGKAMSRVSARRASFTPNICCSAANALETLTGRHISSLTITRDYANELTLFALPDLCMLKCGARIVSPDLRGPRAGLPAPVLPHYQPAGVCLCRRFANVAGILLIVDAVRPGLVFSVPCLTTCTRIAFCCVVDLCLILPMRTRSKITACCGSACVVLREG